eukprot:12883154-Prorocentrum_lima.AAC.1
MENIYGGDTGFLIEQLEVNPMRAAPVQSQKPTHTSKTRPYDDMSATGSEPIVPGQIRKDCQGRV